MIYSSSHQELHKLILAEVSNSNHGYQQSIDNNSSTIVEIPTEKSLLLQKNKLEEGDDDEIKELEEVLDKKQESRAILYKMAYLTCISAIGGFLSGYNTGVISGIMLPIKRVFNLSNGQEELLVSITIGGAFVASIFGGIINHYIGRKYTIMSAAAIFSIGSLVMFVAQSYLQLLLGELLLGIGIGIESLTSPMYIAEVSHVSIRGLFVTMYSVFMVIGQLIAGVINGFFSSLSVEWRYIFLVECFPGIVMFLGFINLPESPVWLVSNHKMKEAKEVLSSIRREEEVDMEIKDIVKSIEKTGGGNTLEKTSHWQSFVNMISVPSTRLQLMVGCGLMMLQQFCGINTVLYYASSIFEMAGFDENSSIWLTCITAIAQIGGQAISVAFVETAGRRKLILISLYSIAFCAIGLGVSFYLARVTSEPITSLDGDDECASVSPSAKLWSGITSFCYDCAQLPNCGFCNGVCVKGTANGPDIFTETCPYNAEWNFQACSNQYAWASVFFMFLYVFVFGIGMGGLPWCINSEIYPYQYRSFAVSLSTSTNWIGNLVLSSTFLTLSSPSNFTLYAFYVGMFGVYSLISFSGATWLYFVLPETKGLSVEKIEEEFSIRSCNKSNYIILNDSHLQDEEHQNIPI